ncbi:MAG: HAMP domain-containing sensor histidine kinase [Syntrophorhabdales bacterium]|jgi:signal transduction histidine kinase
MVAAVLIGCSIPLITYLNHSTASGNQRLHSIYAELHFIPLLLAALIFGFRGALLGSLLVLLLHGAYMVANWHGASLWLVDNSIHIIFPAVFALLVGFLVDLRNTQRRQLEQHRYLSGLGQAAAVLVHDLKSPLLNINAAIRRLDKGTVSSEQAVAAVSEAIGKMEQIMNVALDFSKPLQLNRKEQEATVLIRELLQTSTTRAEQEGVELTTNVTEQSLMIMVDPLYLERALVNLVNNAIEASPKGQSVSIVLRKRNDMAIIKIRDHGKGMDEETLRNLFIPFYSKKGSGTGLGMAVAKKIVEEHEGRITVKSRPAAGTKIAVYLPLIRPTGRR